MRNMIRTAVIATSIGVMAMIGSAGPVGAAAPTHDGADRMVVDIGPEVGEVRRGEGFEVAASRELDGSDRVLAAATVATKNDPDGKGGWGCTTRENGQTDCYKDGTTCTKSKGGTSWVCESGPEVSAGPGSTRPVGESPTALRPGVDQNLLIVDGPPATTVGGPAGIDVGVSVQPGLLELR